MIEPADYGARETTGRPIERLLSWANIRDIALLALIVVVVIKIAQADFQIDLSAFSFTDLLALILALFSVWLSVAFYFKANEGSNRFYDNSYRFTKETSELLGRIEAGFGERLRHLDEGYNQMLGRIDRLPSSAIGAKVDQQEAVIDQVEEERRKLIEDLAERAKLAEGEKSSLFEHLSRTTVQLEMAHQKIAELSRQRVDSPGRTVTMNSASVVLSQAASAIRRAHPNLAIEDLNDTAVQNLWRSILPVLSAARVSAAKESGLLDAHDNLTGRGLTMLSSFVARRIRTDEA